MESVILPRNHMSKALETFNLSLGNYFQQEGFLFGIFSQHPN